jgi:transposase InsO family protein
VPDGGGWRPHGRKEQVRGRGNGYDYLHVAIDDHSRVAYIEALPEERDTTCAGFLYRAVTWFPERGVPVPRILTDKRQGLPGRRQLAGRLCRTGHPPPVQQPGCPWTNGKAERLNRTLLTEFAYAQPWLSNHRLAALDSWVDRYNTRRAHSGLGGRPPITRLAA